MELWFALAIVAIIICLFFSAKFSGAETAITAVDSVEVADLVAKGRKNAHYLVRVKEDLDRTIVAILIGNNLVNVTISALATLLANELLGNLGVSIAIGLLTLVILIFGEITPKAHAVNNKARRSLANARWLYYLTKTLSPLVSVLISVSKGIMRLTGERSTERGFQLVSDTHIRQLTSLGVEQGAVDDVEQDIIERALDFADVTVNEIMVDREDVFTIPSGTSLDDAKALLSARAFTRVPVIKSNMANGGGEGEMTCLDEVVGLVYVKDLLGKEGGVIDDYVRQPFITFPDREAADLFEEMRKNRIHMALVCGEGGKLLGIITLEDLIEEVMGEIHDEVHDKQFPNGEPE